MQYNKWTFLVAFCFGLAVAEPGQAQFWKKKKDKEATEQATVSGLPVAETLSEKDQAAREAYFMEGLKHFMLENYAKALEQFKKANKVDPNNAAINYKIAETSLLLGQPGEALAHSQKALSLDSQNPYYYLLLGQLYTSEQKYAEAAKLYTRLIKDVPNTEIYLFNLADLYLAQNRYDDALKTFDKIEEKFGQLEEVSFKKQQLFLRQNNLKAAIAEGEKLIAANPEDVRYLLAQAELYANNNKIDEAVLMVSKALRTDPANAQARLVYAELLRHQGNMAEAYAQLKQAFGSDNLDVDTKVRILVDYIRQLPNPELENIALQLADSTVKAHPAEAKAFAVAADLQTITGQKKQARENYLKAIKLDNSHFKIWQQIVLLDAELNEIDSMVVHAEQALELFPNQAVFWFYNGTGLVMQKKYDKAIKALEQGKKLVAGNNEMLVQFNIQLGDSYNSLQDYKRSDAAYEEALRYDENNAHVLNNYSYFLALRNDSLDKAKSLAEKLVQLNPDNATYLDTYAWVLYKMQQYTDAKKYLELAVVRTTDATVLEHYGDVLFKLGQTDKAVEQWQKAKQLGGDTSEWIEKKIKDKKLYE